MTGWPTAASIRFTWCFRPSWRVSSSRDGSRRLTSAGAVDAVLELDALGEPGQRLVVGLALDLGLVDLVHLVARVHEPVRERPVVREQEDAGRVRVEPPHRHDAPLMGDEAHDGRPSLRVASGRDDARGLVQEDVRERLRGDLGAVDLDAVCALHERRQARHLAVHGHAACADQLLGATARGDARPGEVGVQAHERSLSRRARLHLAHALDIAGHRRPARLARPGRGERQPSSRSAAGS